VGELVYALSTFSPHRWKFFSALVIERGNFRERVVANAFYGGLSVTAPLAKELFRGEG
jgi:hypothetical protein